MIAHPCIGKFSWRGQHDDIGVKEGRALSLSVSTMHQAPRNRGGETNGPALAVARRSARTWLTNLYLPALALLDFHCCPAALWSADRTQCVFNDAGSALLGFREVDFGTAKDLWLERVDTLDRERFLLAWQSLRDGGAAIVCSYRFLPLNRSLTIELEETALRLPAGPVGTPIVLCRYQLSRPEGEAGGRAELRNLIHQIGNHLQAVRGEAELLRMFGALPQDSFEKISRGIDAIHDLTTQFDGMDRLKIARGADEQAVADSGAGEKPSEAKEV